MPIPHTVLDLIRRFEDNQHSYRAAQFNEAQTREELINPLFEALGWDMRNTQGYSEKFKIRTIDFDDPADVARYDQMVALVERMLALHRQLAEARTPQATRLLRQQIDVTDRAIDQLVYALYELTPEEIAIVEGGN